MGPLPERLLLGSSVSDGVSNVLRLSPTWPLSSSLREGLALPSSSCFPIERKRSAETPGGPGYNEVQPG